MFYRYFLSTLYISIFVLVVIVLGKPWGYDEFGVLITQLELTNESFKNFYLDYLSRFLNNALLKEFFLNTLPIYVSPLRWTYAIGISPIYSIIYLFPMDWDIASRLFLLIHIVIASFGISLLSNVLNSSKFEKNVLILLVSIILISKNFNYWTLTLTHYSFNIICFAILVTIYSNKKYTESTEVISFKGITLFFAAILNYFYVPILFVIALYEILLYKSKFFTKGIYRSWILCGIGSFLGLCFILIRTKFLNTNGLWSQAAYDQYLIYGDTFRETIANFSERIIQIFYYFYLDNDYKNNFILSKDFDLTIFDASLILVLAIIIIYQGYKHSPNKNIAKVCIAVIFVSLFEYIFTLIPMIPSRHSLILFIPISYFLSVLLIKALSIFMNQININFFLMIFLTFSVFIFFLDSWKQNETNQTFDIIKIEECLSGKVDQIVLDKCYLEPVMYKSIRKNYHPVYSCGKRVIEKISNETYKIAFLSRELTKDRTAYIESFLDEEYFLVKDNNQQCKVKNIDIRFYEIDKNDK